MIAKITDAGYVLGFDVERALRSVERHLFVPDATLEDAYANDIVVTKRGADDQVLSQPGGNSMESNQGPLGRWSDRTKTVMGTYRREQLRLDDPGGGS